MTRVPIQTCTLTHEEAVYSILNSRARLKVNAAMRGTPQIWLRGAMADICCDTRDRVPLVGISLFLFCYCTCPSYYKL